MELGILTIPFGAFSNFLCVCKGGAIDFIDGAGLRMLGINDEQKIIGKKISEFLAPEFVNISDNSRDFLILIQDEEEALYTTVIGPEGHETAVEISVYWAREFGENSVIVKANDISKQMDLTQELQRGQERFSRLVDNAMDMICSCKDGTVSFINKPGVKFLNAETRDQIIGPSVASFFHENYQEIFGEFIQDLIQDDDRFPAKLARLDGTHVDVHIAITQTYPSSYQNYMLEVRDISEPRRAIMALHDINLDLEKRVKEWTRELSQEIIIRKKAEKNFVLW